MKSPLDFFLYIIMKMLKQSTELKEFFVVNTCIAHLLSVFSDITEAGYRWGQQQRSSLKGRVEGRGLHGPSLVSLYSAKSVKPLSCGWPYVLATQQDWLLSLHRQFLSLHNKFQATAVSHWKKVPDLNTLHPYIVLTTKTGGELESSEI